MRLWPCKIDLNPPVTLSYRSLLRYFCGGSFCFMSWCLKYFVPYVSFHIFSKVKVTEWPPIAKIAAHLAYEMFLWTKYLIVSSVFSRLSFWSGNRSLIAPFPDLCLLVPFFSNRTTYVQILKFTCRLNKTFSQRHWSMRRDAMCFVEIKWSTLKKLRGYRWVLCC